MSPRRRIPTDTPLRDSPEEAVGLSLPIALSDRVDTLVGIAEGGGDRTDRKELIAALILAAPIGTKDLATALRRYRLAKVRDATLRDQGVAQSIAIPIRRPGPRRRRPGR